MEGEGGVERLTEKAERLLKLIERMSTGERNRTTEKGLVNERVCLRESVCESSTGCPNMFSSPHNSGNWGLWVSQFGPGLRRVQGFGQTNQKLIQFTIRRHRERLDPNTWRGKLETYYEGNYSYDCK